MKILSLELTKAAQLPLVRKVILSDDKKTVAVELKASRPAGLPVKNILYFTAKGFTAGKLQLGIDQLTTTYKNPKAER